MYNQSILIKQTSGAAERGVRDADRDSLNQVSVVQFIVHLLSFSLGSQIKSWKFYFEEVCTRQARVSHFDVEMKCLATSAEKSASNLLALSLILKLILPRKIDN